MAPSIHTFVIQANFAPAGEDGPAMWVGVNDELGLVVEAESLDGLVAKVDQVIDDLFEANVLPRLQREKPATVFTPGVSLSAMLDGFRGHGGTLSRPDCFA